MPEAIQGDVTRFASMCQVRWEALRVEDKTQYKINKRLQQEQRISALDRKSVGRERVCRLV